MALLAGFTAILGQALFEGLAEPANTAQHRRRRSQSQRRDDDDSRGAQHWSLDNGDPTSPRSLAREAVLDYKRRTTGEGSRSPAAADAHQWSSERSDDDDASRRSLAREAVLDYRRWTGGTSPSHSDRCPSTRPSGDTISMRIL